MPSALDQLHPNARRLAEHHLDADEAVVTVVPGRSRQAMIVTDRRILMLKPGLLSGVWLGSKAAAFALTEVTTVNMHTGRGVVALEVVIDDKPHPGKPDLVAAFQLPNWLPCRSSLAGSTVVADLRAFVQSDGRSRPPGAELGR